MANLEDLTAFDQHLRLATKDLRILTQSRGRERGVWSEKQEVQFSQLLGAVMHLHDALSELVAQNR
jgi:hypothetical protein